MGGGTSIPSQPSNFARESKPASQMQSWTNSFGQYCNIHSFLSFLGSLLKQCISFDIFLQFSLLPPSTNLKLGKILDTRVQYVLWGEGTGWTCVNWKTLQKRVSVPRLLSMIVVKILLKDYLQIRQERIYTLEPVHSLQPFLKK